MALEAGTYISDLVATNPTASDPKSAGDDHLRLLKSTIKTTFPNVAGAMTATHTELNYMVGVTSLVQGQLNSKGAIAGQTWTGTHVFPSTTSIGTVTAAEIARLSGVTSAIQTQIDSKGAITGQTWTGTHTFPSTVSFGPVSATEISYLDGVTSALQTQLDAKAPLASPALTGVPTAPTAAVNTNTTQVATTAFVIGQAFSAALPAPSAGFVRNDGTTTAFSQTHTGYAQKEVKGANIASAANINLSTATGNLVHITGNTGITAFTIDSGAEYTVVFDGILTVTNSANVILPSGMNEITAVGDVWTIRGDGANIARITNMQSIGRTQISVSGSQLDKTSDITLANIPNLSATLVAGGTYKIRVVAYVTAIAGAGTNFSFGGGSATATSFVAVFTSGLSGTPIRVTTLAGNMNNSSNNGTIAVIEATIICNAAGTLIPQFAQGASNGTASSVLALSTMTVERIS